MTDLPQDKYIKIMADYCADGCWNRDGAATSLDDYPLSEETKTRIREWQWFHDTFCHDYDPEEDSFPNREFDIWGSVLAAQVKKELPDYEVVCWMPDGVEEVK